MRAEPPWMRLVPFWERSQKAPCSFCLENREKTAFCTPRTHPESAGALILLLELWPISVVYISHQIYDINSNPDRLFPLFPLNRLPNLKTAIFPFLPFSVTYFFSLQLVKYNFINYSSITTWFLAFQYQTQHQAEDFFFHTDATALAN